MIDLALERNKTRFYLMHVYAWGMSYSDIVDGMAYRSMPLYIEAPVIQFSDIRAENQLPMSSDNLSLCLGHIKFYPNNHSVKTT